ncbi:MAG: hypothetical protein GX444_01250 [Myxococcales bacterium]|nr:hypothetical protein [Myxococcales bacterium]
MSHDPGKDSAAGWIRLAGYLTSIAGTVAGIVWGIPYLFARSPSQAVAWSLLVMIVPLFPAVQTFLQGERRFSVTLFWRIYIAEYVSLFLELLFILIILPLVAFALLYFVLWMMFVVVGIVTLGWLLQTYLGVSLGMSIAREEAPLLFAIFFGLALALVVLHFLRRLAAKHEEGFFAFFRTRFEAIKALFRY